MAMVPKYLESSVVSEDTRRLGGRRSHGKMTSYSGIEDLAEHAAVLQVACAMLAYGQCGERGHVAVGAVGHRLERAPGEGCA